MRLKIWNMRKTTTKEFIDKANLIHGYKYDYSNTIYIDSNNKIIISCPEHGKFEQRASAHIGKQRQGCPTCNTMKRRNNLLYLLDKAKEIHGDKYDYSLVIEYKTARTHVDVICKTHGPFKITPHHHINRKQG